MAAVLGIVRGHDGTIIVDGEPGKGASIQVLFPAAEESAKPLKSPKPRKAEDWKATGTVLLVDDDESVLSMGKLMLEKLGLDVLTAIDGNEAVGVYRRRADEIVCVLLDLTMPIMDGDMTFDALRQVRSDVPVVLLSGYGKLEITTRFANRGFTGFIEKPYALDDLRTMMKKVLAD